MTRTREFRPWGDLTWLLPQLGNEQFHFVGCVGTEDRSTIAFAEMRHHNANSALTFVEVIDPPSEYSIPAQEKRGKNRDLFSRLLGAPVQAERLDLFAREHLIAEWIERYVLSSPRVALDISCLPKRFFFPALKMALMSVKVKDLIVLYTPAGDYPTVEHMAERPSDWRALPFFGVESFPDPKYDVAIVGVGFLPFGLPDLLKPGLYGAKPHLLFPFPASPETFRMTWNFVRQINATLSLNDTDQLTRVNGMDTSDTFDHICWLTKHGELNALFAPYGPKPMSLAMAIYASLTHSPVYYTQPRTYHPDYSRGWRVSPSGEPEVAAYCVKLDGRCLYKV